MPKAMASRSGSVTPARKSFTEGCVSALATPPIARQVTSAANESATVPTPSIASAAMPTPIRTAARGPSLWPSRPRPGEQIADTPK